MKSIRRRLLLSLLVGMAVIASLTGVLMFRHIRHELDELYNANLRQQAVLLARQFDTQDVTTLPPDEPIAATDVWEEEDYLIQLWDRQGHLLDEYIPAPTSVEVPLVANAGLHRPRLGKESWRVYRADGARVSVQIAQPESARKNTITETSLMLWLPLTLQVPLLMLLAWICVRRGLRPLDQLSAAIAQRRPDALLPLDASAQPAELQVLVATLNVLLARLDAALRQQRDFIADAAHELRTPVAALQLQLDLLSRAQNEADRERGEAELRNGLQRVTHLIQQLLSVARAEAATAADQSIDLRKLGEKIVERHLPMARDRAIDLGVTRLDAGELVCACADVEALLDNLLDNAIRYTPRGGTVDLAIWREDASVLMEVTDTGSGIPASERARVFDRFYRVLQVDDAATPITGSGLGLAIVKAICDRNHARIAIGDGVNGIGTRITVRWPA